MMPSANAAFVAVLMGIQVIPSTVGVTQPLPSTGSTTSMVHLPVFRRSRVRLAIPWKLLPFAPGNAPMNKTYSPSSRSGWVLFEAVSASARAVWEPPQVEPWPYWFSEPKQLVKRVPMVVRPSPRPPSMTNWFDTGPRSG